MNYTWPWTSMNFSTMLRIWSNNSGKSWADISCPISSLACFCSWGPNFSLLQTNSLNNCPMKRLTLLSFLQKGKFTKCNSFYILLQVWAITYIALFEHDDSVLVVIALNSELVCEWNEPRPELEHDIVLAEKAFSGRPKSPVCFLVVVGRATPPRANRNHVMLAHSLICSSRSCSDDWWLARRLPILRWNSSICPSSPLPFG